MVPHSAIKVVVLLRTMMNHIFLFYSPKTTSAYCAIVRQHGAIPASLLLLVGEKKAKLGKRGFWSGRRRGRRKPPLFPAEKGLKQNFKSLYVSRKDGGKQTPRRDPLF